MDTLLNAQERELAPEDASVLSHGDPRGTALQGRHRPGADQRGHGHFAAHPQSARIRRAELARQWVARTGLCPAPHLARRDAAHLRPTTCTSFSIYVLLRMGEGCTVAVGREDLGMRRGCRLTCDVQGLLHVIGDSRAGICYSFRWRGVSLSPCDEGRPRRRERLLTISVPDSGLETRLRAASPRVERPVG